MSVQAQRASVRPDRGRAGRINNSGVNGNPLILAVLLVGQMMCIIDVFVVNVAMPSIGSRLHASGASLQLIVGGYTIAYATLLITGARLGDRYGRRRLYLTGVCLFTAASLACALAPDSRSLVVFRFVQGAGAAVLVPQIFSIIQLRFTGRARARALSAYAAVLSCGAVAGLVLGGVIVTANLFGQGWRPVFAINVPVGVLLAVLVPRTLPVDEASGAGAGASGAGAGAGGAGAGVGGAGVGAPRLDIAGLTVSAAAVLLLVVPLVLGQESGWPAWTFVSLAGGAAACAGFVWVERRVAARGGHPLLNLDVVRSPGLSAGLAALLSTQIGYGGSLFVFTLYLETARGESALRTGLSYLPMAAAFGLIGYFWRRLPAGSHGALPAVGLVTLAGGYLFTAVAVRSGHPAPANIDLGLAVIGAGLGLSVSPLLTRSLFRVRPERATDASGLLTTSVQLGQLSGVAVLGSIYLAFHNSPHTGISTVAYVMMALSVIGLLPAVVPTRGVRRGRSTT